MIDLQITLLLWRLSFNLLFIRRPSDGVGDPHTYRPKSSRENIFPKLWDDADSFALNEKHRHQETNPHLQRPSIFQTVSLVLPWSSFLPRLSTRRYGNRFKSAFGCPNDFQLKILNSRLHLTPIAEDNDYVHCPTRDLASWLKDILALALRLFKAETKIKQYVFCYLVIAKSREARHTSVLRNSSSRIMTIQNRLHRRTENVTRTYQNLDQQL
ncbi:hypothetical protein PGTUg99_036759 [Puccinia graminis f. sp. tritici]|uniref:Uncharacterized protein n=1 Tax=Puccinia graminis f. sp. tritici TaxID=56615 RepID=A0A5B0NQM3_PUCGR|nr:hypothetical protein PGTUg99_036759 [Puccinia graminis f. sp. tritici]